MYTKFLLTLLALSLLFPCHSSAADYKMATTNWPPFYADNLKNGGPLTEIVTEAFKRMGHSTVTEFLPWTRARRKVLIGEADIILGAYHSDQRAEKHHFSAPIMMVDVALIAHKKLGIHSFKNLTELTPYSIGVSKGWVNSPEFDRANYLSKDVASNQVLNIRKLARNRVDIISISSEVFKYELAQNNLSGTLSQYVFLEPLLSKSGLRLMMRKSHINHEKVISEFNSTLEFMKKDGSYQRILKKHHIDPESAGCP